MLSFELGYTDGFNRTADMAGIGLASTQKEAVVQAKSNLEKETRRCVRHQHHTKQLQLQNQAGEFKRKWNGLLVSLAPTAFW